MAEYQEPCVCIFIFNNVRRLTPASLPWLSTRRKSLVLSTAPISSGSSAQVGRSSAQGSVSGRGRFFCACGSGRELRSAKKSAIVVLCLYRLYIEENRLATNMNRRKAASYEDAQVVFFVRVSSASSLLEHKGDTQTGTHQGSANASRHKGVPKMRLSFFRHQQVPNQTSCSRIYSRRRLRLSRLGSFSSGPFVTQVFKYV